jgi:hypothetical protein
MPTACHAVSAMSADDVTFTTDNVADLEVMDIASDLNDLADEFVAYDHWNRNRFLRPGIPFVNVQICPTDSCSIDADQDVIDATSGLGDVLQPQPAFCVFLYQGFHPFTRSTLPKRKQVDQVKGLKLSKNS